MIIYIAINNTTTKAYIGQTIRTLKERMNQHRRDAKNRPRNNHFYCAINKYGFDSFSWRVLDTASTLEELNILEEYYIDLFGTSFNDIGYNATTGGDNKIANAETREKQSKAKKGKPLSEKHKEALKLNIGLGMAGRHHSEESRTKIRDSKIGQNKGEKHPMYGKHHSEETKQKLRSIKRAWVYKGEVQTCIRLEKLSEYLESGWTRGRLRGGTPKGQPSGAKGKKHTEEQNRAKSERQKGRKLSEGHKNALYEGRQKFHEERGFKGENNPFYGRKHSEETKEKIRIAKQLQHKD